MDRYVMFEINHLQDSIESYIRDIEQLESELNYCDGEEYISIEKEINNIERIIENVENRKRRLEKEYEDYDMVLDNMC